MKHILIIGAGSYIGTSFERYVAQWPEDYYVDTVDARGDAWRKIGFKGYDSVFHVAGIAHIKETEQNKETYYTVNRDLAIQAAKKAKEEGIGHFAFLSSMSIYGMEQGVITEDTIPKPISHYGKSKLQAEEGLSMLEDNNFSVAILRPPMVYGKKCKGNYASLSMLSRKLPFFPIVANERSMIYIDNLCEFVRLTIQHQASGVFLPQNKTYVNTSDMVSRIAHVHHKRILMVKGFGWIISALRRFKSIGKAFGSLTYDLPLSEYKDWDYRIIDFDESIKRTEE